MRLALSGLSPPRDRDLLPLNDLTHDLGAAGETRARGSSAGCLAFVPDSGSAECGQRGVPRVNFPG